MTSTADRAALLDAHGPARAVPARAVLARAVPALLEWTAAGNQDTVDSLRRRLRHQSTTAFPPGNAALPTFPALGDHGRCTAIRDWNLGDVHRLPLRPAGPADPAAGPDRDLRVSAGRAGRAGEAHPGVGPPLRAGPMSPLRCGVRPRRRLPGAERRRPLSGCGGGASLCG